MLPQYTTTFHCQSNTDHTLKCTHASTINYHSPKCRLSPPTTHTTINLQHHMPFQPTHKAHTAATHLTTYTAALKSSHVHQQYKHTLTHHTKNNQSIKTIHINTTQPPQHTFHKIHHKRNQANTLKPQHRTIFTPNIVTVSHPIPQLFHQQIKTAIINLLIQHGNQSTQKRHR